MPRGRYGRANAWSTVGQGISSIGQQIMQQALAKQQQEREDERFNKSYALQERGQAASEDHFTRSFDQANEHFGVTSGLAKDQLASQNKYQQGMLGVAQADSRRATDWQEGEAVRAGRDHGFRMSELQAAQARFMEEITRDRDTNRMFAPVAEALSAGKSPTPVLAQLRDDYTGPPNTARGPRATGLVPAGTPKQVDPRIWSDPEEMLGAVGQRTLGAQTQMAAAQLAGGRAQAVQQEVSEAQVDQVRRQLRTLYDVNTNLPRDPEGAYFNQRNQALAAMAYLIAEDPSLSETEAAQYVLDNAGRDLTRDGFNDLKQFLKLPNYSVPVRR